MCPKIAGKYGRCLNELIDALLNYEVYYRLKVV